MAEELGLEAAGGFNVLGLWPLSLSMGGCRKGGRRCWDGAGWFGVTFCKQPRSAPLLVLSPQAEVCSPGVCPVRLIKSQTEKGELVCRDTLRGSQRGYLPANNWLFAGKAGPCPRWVRGGREAASAGGGAHICQGEERLRAAMVKDGAGSSSNSVMPFSGGGSVLAGILPSSSSAGAVCKEPLALELLGLARGRELSPEPCDTPQSRAGHPPAVPRVGLHGG